MSEEALWHEIRDAEQRIGRIEDELLKLLTERADEAAAENKATADAREQHIQRRFVISTVLSVVSVALFALSVVVAVLTAVGAF